MQIAEAFVAVRAEVNPAQFKSDVTRGISQPMAQAGADAGKKAGQAAGKGVGEGLQSQAARVRSSLAGIFASAVFARGVKGAIDAASALQEQVSGTGAVFADARGEIDAFAKGAAQALGTSEEDARRAANTFGGLFRALGVGSEDAAKFSITLTTLATDLASLKDTPIQDAFIALQSGLVGEAEPLRRFGVSLSEARLQQEALALGLTKSKGPLDAAAKAQSALSIILKDTKLAQGDFNRTRDSAANTEKRAAAELKNTSAEIGQNLLPAYQRLSEIVGQLAHIFGSLPGPVQSSVVALAGVAIVAKPLRDLSQLAGGLQSRFLNAEGGATRLSTSIKGLGAALGIAGAGVAAVNLIDAAIDNLGGEAPKVDSLTAAVEAFAATGKITGQLQESFGANADKLGEMTERALALQDLGGGAGGFLGKLGTALTGEGGKSEEAKKAFQALDETLTALASNGSADVAAKQFEFLSDKFREQGLEIQGLFDLFPKYQQLLADANTRTKAGVESNDAYNLSLKATGTRAKLTGDELKKLADSLFATGEAQLKAADSGQALAEAQTDLAELRETAAGRGPAQAAAIEQIRQATEGLTDATEDQSDAVKSLQRSRKDLADFESGTSRTIRDLERQQIVDREVTTSDDARDKALDLLKFDQQAADERQRLQDGVTDAEGRVEDAAQKVKDAQDDVRKANQEREKQQLDAAAKITEAEREVQQAALEIAQGYAQIVAEQGTASAGAAAYRAELEKATPVLQGLVDLSALLAATASQFTVTTGAPVPGTPETLRRSGLSIGDIVGGRNFQSGGVVPGVGPVPIMAHGGETVIPAGQQVGGVSFVANFHGGDVPTTTQLDAIARKLAIRVGLGGRR